MNRICTYPGCTVPLPQGIGRPAKFCTEHKQMALAEKKRRYYEANRDEIAEKQRLYREANRDEIAEKRRRYYEANRDKIAEKQRRYYEAKRDEIAEKRRRYYEARKARRAALLDEFTRHLQNKRQKEPEQRPEYLISAAVSSGRCENCGQTFILRYPGQQYCKKPRCQQAERKRYGTLRIAISRIAAGDRYD